MGSTMQHDERRDSADAMLEGRTSSSTNAEGAVV